MIYPRFGKRLFDLAIAITASVVLLPVILLTALVVKVKLGRPVVFRQSRVGRDGVIFTLYKFRTMTDLCDTTGQVLPDERRLTNAGAVLRRWSLDELPQIWNVMRGEMSIVGPRPLLARYLDRYNQHQARRHEVRPGCTGWAQVNGRNDLSWEERFELDVWYIDRLSVLLDFKILVLTLISVVKRRGINAQGKATMEEFMGSKVP